MFAIFLLIVSNSNRNTKFGWDISGQGPPVVQDYNHGKGVNSGPSPRLPLPLPDLSKPPPGFPPGPPPNIPAPMSDVDLTPSVPYFELPAGLMAPLVKVRL